MVLGCALSREPHEKEDKDEEKKEIETGGKEN